jgi:hypothetical protein
VARREVWSAPQEDQAGEASDVHGVETILFLVVLGTVVAAFAGRLRVPAPSLLVIAGLVVALLPSVSSAGLRWFFRRRACLGHEEPAPGSVTDARTPMPGGHG